MKKLIVILAVIMMINTVVVNADTENNLSLQSSNITDRQIGVDQNIIIELTFSGKINNEDDSKSVSHDYELYEDDEKGNLTRVNIAVNSNRNASNDSYETIVKIKPEDKLKPLTSYVLIAKESNGNNELRINFRTKDNSTMQYTYMVIAAVCLAALYIFKIKK